MKPLGMNIPQFIIWVCCVLIGGFTGALAANKIIDTFPNPIISGGIIFSIASGLVLLVIYLAKTDYVIEVN
jgi:hypothetical protein